MNDHLGSDEIRIPRGKVIFRQGDEGNEMFLIRSGRVRLTVGNDEYPTELATLVEGEFFGELALLESSRRKATATAAEDTVLLRIERDTFAMLVQDDLGIVFHMFNVQGRRLAQTNQPVEALSEILGCVGLGLQALDEYLKEGRLPLSLGLGELARGSGVSETIAKRTVEEFAKGGAGGLRDCAWVLDGPAQIRALVAGLRRMAWVG